MFGSMKCRQSTVAAIETMKADKRDQIIPHAQISLSDYKDT